ncbi:hypothetical protein Tsubulata_034145 [Turnera subulata]|uniref:Uncharacterized protein n=1 Tax=Turnera subulata TaxID=218843 RepID=A0A9Q0FKB3_9ROSI|nr:hypothetical protein Tsubulata_034145 [Turnera subulata]
MNWWLWPGCCCGWVEMWECYRECYYWVWIRGGRWYPWVEVGDCDSADDAEEVDEWVAVACWVAEVAIEGVGLWLGEGVGSVIEAGWVGVLLLGHWWPVVAMARRPRCSWLGPW